jgi:hypothetical protein
MTVVKPKWYLLPIRENIYAIRRTYFGAPKRDRRTHGWNTRLGRMELRTRKAVWIRDCYVCQYCGLDMKSAYLTWKKTARPWTEYNTERQKVALTADHVIPRIQGGRTHVDNLVTACESCNKSKGGRGVWLPTFFYLWLRIKGEWRRRGAWMNPHGKLVRSPISRDMLAAWQRRASRTTTRSASKSAARSLPLGSGSSDKGEHS